jgi:hypothetical protein
MVDGGQPLLNAFGLGSSILGTVDIQVPHHNSTLSCSPIDPTSQITEIAPEPKFERR